MAKQILNDEDLEQNSSTEPSNEDIINSVSTKLDPENQQMSDQLVASRPSDNNVQDDSNNLEDNSQDEVPNEPVPEIDQLKTLLAKSSGKIPVQSRMNTSDAINSLLGQRDADLSSAQQLRNKLELMAGLERASQTIGSAFAPMANLKPDEEGYKAAMMQAQQPVADILQKNQVHQQALKDSLEQVQIKKQIAYQDPNSDESQSFRKAVLTVNPNLAKVYGDDFNNITAADKDLIFDPIKLKEQMDMRKQMSANTLEWKKSMAEQNATAKQDKADQQQQVQDEKIQKDFVKSINTLSQSSRSVVGRAAGAKVSVNRLLDIVNDPNATNQDLNNAYTDMTAVIANGTPAMGAVAHNSYNTLANKIAEFKQFWSDKPQAPVNPQIKQHVADLANRMNQISDGVIKQHLGTVSAGVTGWAKRHPDEYEQIIKSASMDSSPAEPNPSTNQSPGMTASSQSTGPHGPSVVQNGHTYNWNPTTGKYE